MKSLVLTVAACVLIVLGAGCSRKEIAPAETPPPAETPAPQSAAASPTAAPATAVAQLESSVNTALKQQNYDAAVDAVLQVQSAAANLSDDQRRQYAQQFRNTSAALQAASATDPKAKAAYDRMSRAVLGR